MVNGMDTSPTSPTQTGLLIRRSLFDFDSTVAAIRSVLDDRGISLFSVVDHAEAAAAAGLTMPPTTVLIFGNPAVGTPLMVATPDLAIELPSRVLVRQAGEHVEVVFADAEAMAQRYGLQPSALAGLAALTKIIDVALSTQD